MEVLPVVLSHEVLFFLEVRELYLICTLVSQYWRELTRNDSLIRRLFYREFGIPIKGIPGNIWEIFGANACNTSDKLKPIQMYGLGTTGGVDAMEPGYWVDCMFKNNGSIYCSEDQVDNFMVMACLSSLVRGENDENDAFRQARVRGAQYLRNCQPIHTLIPNVDFADLTELDASTTRLFLELADGLPDVFTMNLQPGQTAEQVLADIDSIANALSPNESDLNQFKRYPDNNYVLIKPVEYVQYLSPEQMPIALLHSFIFEYASHCTCPLNTFAVFVSNLFVDIESEVFKTFDGIKTSEQLKEVALASAGAFPEVLHEHIQPTHAFVELKRTDIGSGVTPVLWGRVYNP